MIDASFGNLRCAARLHDAAPTRAKGGLISKGSVYLTPHTFDTGKRYRITTAGYHGDRYTARAKTYGDVLLEYGFHGIKMRGCERKSVR